MQAQNFIARANARETESRNKAIVDTYISSYQEQTKSAIEHILNMCKTVYQVNEKVLTQELSLKDLRYFCNQVSLDRKSSYYRKHICIGKHAEVFSKYIEKLPSAVSVLYQIATLDSDKFEELVQNDQITPSITLREVQLLSPNFKRNDGTKEASTFVSIKLKFDAKSVDPLKLERIVMLCNDLDNSDDVEVDFNKEELNSLLDFHSPEKLVA